MICERGHVGRESRIYSKQMVQNTAVIMSMQYKLYMLVKNMTKKSKEKLSQDSRFGMSCPIYMRNAKKVRMMTAILCHSVEI